MQCKERVDLLEALRKSRKEAKDKEKEKESENSLKSGSTMWGRPPVPKKIHNSTGQQSSPTWMGDGTVPPVNYPDYSRAPPPLPHRPAFPKLDSTSPTERSDSSSPFSMMPPPPTPPQPSQSPATLPVPLKKTSRTPSPEKKGRVMLTTLRGRRTARSLRNHLELLLGGLLPPARIVKSCRTCVGLNIQSCGAEVGTDLGRTKWQYHYSGLCSP